MAVLALPLNVAYQPLKVYPALVGVGKSVYVHEVAFATRVVS